MSAPHFRDDVVMVTGGTSGVGLETAIEFARQGARKLVVVGRDEQRGAGAVGAIKERTDADALFISADLEQAGDAVALAQQVVRAFGRLDVLVNSLNSGSMPRLLHETPVEAIKTLFLGRAIGTMHASCAVLPLMREQKSGVIINVASDAAKVPTPGEAVIGAGMAAIVTFSKTMAAEAKRDGIRVNVVTPSLVGETGGFDQVMADPFSARLFQKAIKLAHLGLPTAADLAQLIAFLAGPHAARITGQAISVNGGISSV